MFFRMAVLIGAIQPALLRGMGLALVTSGLVLLLLGLRQVAPDRAAIRQRGTGGDGTTLRPGHALGFGVFLALMAVLVSRSGMAGPQGIYALSAVRPGRRRSDRDLAGTPAGRRRAAGDDDPRWRSGSPR